MDADGTGHVWLDLRGLDATAFPSVFATIRAAGVDPETELVPVAPASHYLIGGVATDLDGRTTLPGLYAVGECACTGLHGANRLASNSLSECFVFGARAAAATLSEPDPPDPLPEPEWRFEPPTVATREALWRSAGPRRTAAELETLLPDRYPLARMVAASALARKESRGAHRRVDFPRLDPLLAGIHFVVAADGSIRSERWA
jgi:L-aspartate oxidase